MLVAGGFTALLGILLPTINGDQDKVRTVTIQIAVYAISWALLACAPGEATHGRRIVLAILGAWALLVVVLLLRDLPLYLDYWKIRETPLYLFWLFAGVLETGAALVGGFRPTRRLELVSGGLTVAFGLLILYLVNQLADLAWVVGSFSLYFIALGATWVLIGLRRRMAAGAS
jgi:MYXO-CTERM domain-containing protein